MARTSRTKARQPWNIHFFQRYAADDPARGVPAIEFLDSIPAKVAAEIHAVLDAVANGAAAFVLGWRQVGGHAR